MKTSIHFISECHTKILLELLDTENRVLQRPMFAFALRSGWLDAMFEGAFITFSTANRCTSLIPVDVKFRPLIGSGLKFVIIDISKRYCDVYDKEKISKSVKCKLSFV